MVQVDVIWSYAFGASFAAAATRQLSKEKRAFNNSQFSRLLIYLCAFFAPSGIFLLWAFPQWETMQVARSLEDLPPWLVTIFGISNVTQGIIGYWVGYWLCRRGRFYAAHLNWFLSWTLFWFVLVAGWDTTGYQRFLYDMRLHDMALWTPGLHDGWSFFIGPVFTSLVVMGVLFAPALHLGVVDRNFQDLRSAPEIHGIDISNYLKINFATYVGMFGVTLGLAIVAAWVVRVAVAMTGDMISGYIVGLGVSTMTFYLLLMRRGYPVHRFLKMLYIKDAGDKI